MGKNGQKWTLKITKMALLTGFSPNNAQSSVGVRKCRGCQNVGNDLNYLQKNTKMVRSRFLGHVEPENGQKRYLAKKGHNWGWGFKIYAQLHIFT